jgi:hypothetical protein
VTRCCLGDVGICIPSCIGRKKEIAKVLKIDLDKPIRVKQNPAVTTAGQKRTVKLVTPPQYSVYDGGRRVFSQVSEEFINESYENYEPKERWVALYPRGIYGTDSKPELGHIHLSEALARRANMTESGEIAPKGTLFIRLPDEDES